MGSTLLGIHGVARILNQMGVAEPEVCALNLSDDYKREKWKTCRYRDAWDTRLCPWMHSRCARNTPEFKCDEIEMWRNAFCEIRKQNEVQSAHLAPEWVRPKKQSLFVTSMLGLSNLQLSSHLRRCWERVSKLMYFFCFVHLTLHHNGRTKTINWTTVKSCRGCDSIRIESRQ